MILGIPSLYAMNKRHMPWIRALPSQPIAMVTKDLGIFEDFSGAGLLMATIKVSAALWTKLAHEPVFLGDEAFLAFITTELEKRIPFRQNLKRNVLIQLLTLLNTSEVEVTRPNYD